jgi:putative ABC transport system permease protein
MRLFMGHGIRLAIAGTVLGLAAAAGLTRLLAKFLFGVKAGDPLAFFMVAVTLVIVTLIAAFVPTTRAMRLDPVKALRQE